MRKLTLREQILVVGGAVCLVLILLWQMVLSPALTDRKHNLDMLMRIDAISALLDVLPASSERLSLGNLPPLRQRVTESAALAGLEIRRLDPQGPALSVALDQVSFTAFIGWVDQITTAEGVRILSAEIGRRPEPGIVSARVLLEASQ